MTKAFVDTSVILPILIKDDELKAKAAVNLLKSAGEKGLVLYLLPGATWTRLKSCSGRWTWNQIQNNWNGCG